MSDTAIKQQLSYMGKVRVDLVYADGKAKTIYKHNTGNKTLSLLFAQCLTNQTHANNLPTYLGVRVYTGDSINSINALQDRIILTGKTCTVEATADGDIYFANFNGSIGKVDLNAASQGYRSTQLQIISQAGDELAHVDIDSLDLNELVGDNKILVVRWSMGLVNYTEEER